MSTSLGHLFDKLLADSFNIQEKRKLNMQEDPSKKNKPDFGFIVNQAPPVVEHKQRNKKPLVLLGVAGAFLVIVMVLGLLAAHANKTANTQTQAASPAAAAQALLGDFASNQPSQAFALLGSDYQKANTLSGFSKTVTLMNSNVDLSKCVISADTGKQNVTQAKCPMRRGSGSITYTVTTQPEAQGKKQVYVITALKWQLDKQVTTADIQ